MGNEGGETQWISLNRNLTNFFWYSFFYKLHFKITLGVGQNVQIMSMPVVFFEFM